MAQELIGQYIAHTRKTLQMTQLQLSNCLGVSPQAVSKWERGEGMPDIGLLLPLSEALQTTVDLLLKGGNFGSQYTKRVDVLAIVTGMKTLASLGHYLGREHLIYQGIVEGINGKMNVDIETYFQDSYCMEAMVSEVVITEILSGAYVNMAEVELYLQHSHWKSKISEYWDKASQ